MTRVLITGGSGLVGSRIIELLKTDFEFLAPESTQLDISSRNSVAAYLATQQFDQVIHLAAYTNVEGAETNREVCHLINVEGTRNLFEETQKLNKPFIQISTDFVFSGQDSEYTENSTPKATGYYGQTKAEAETIVRDWGMIVRISYPYRAKYELKKDFVKSIRTLLEQGRTISAVSDSLFTPTFIDDIALGLRHLLTRFEPTIFHIVGSQSLSPYDAFQEIARVFGYSTDLIQPITYAQYFKDKAPRPQFSKILNTKLPLNFHSFSEGLQLVKAG